MLQITSTVRGIYLELSSFLELGGLAQLEPQE